MKKLSSFRFAHWLVVIVGMGIMVAFLVFAILMPMLKMNEVITG